LQQFRSNADTIYWPNNGKVNSENYKHSGLRRALMYFQGRPGDDLGRFVLVTISQDSENLKMFARVR